MNESSDNHSGSFVFSTPEGHTLCRRLISAKLGYSPHDYQLEGVCKALDGVDLLAITPTGSGKTGFLVMYLLVMHSISDRPTLCGSQKPPSHFQKKATMIVICPTLSLEDETERKFHAGGFSTLIINKDTTDRARREDPPREIWDAAPAAEVLLLSPEQLTSANFAALLRNKEYQSRVVVLGVDEIHLLNTWGKTFRRDFLEIGSVRMRFEHRPQIIALSATLRSGLPFRSVCAFLGLHSGHYYLIRRSNMRYDIRLIFRTIQSSIRSYTFPELDWTLSANRRVIIFCPTIHLGFRVAMYLRARAHGLDDLEQRIRMYSALNWASYNSNTVRLMHVDSRSWVTIATDALAVGIDVSNTDDVVLYDHVLPSDTDVILQKAGRIRDGRGRQSRVVVYQPQNAVQASETAIAEAEKSLGNNQDLSTGALSSRKSFVDVDVARLVLAQCKIDFLDKLYDNPIKDQPCTCPYCIANPPLPRPAQCSCSGCMPEQENTPPTSRAVLPTQKKPRVPAAQYVTRKMQDVARSRFAEFRKALREDSDVCLHDLFPPEELLPDDLINGILQELYSLDSVSDLRRLVGSNELLEAHCDSLMEVIEEIRQAFARMRAEAKAAKAAKAKATRERKKLQATEGRKDGGNSDDSEFISGDSDSLQVYSNKGEASGRERSTEVNESGDYRGVRSGQDLQGIRLTIRVPGGRWPGRRPLG
ncbi:hypothetical protein BN946_scf185013.g160 [Trametes cinnabarina]|uniref:DNA 3'-5' helicase n=1 Tax=Pycnoporus cinnabarinus TaxID=5643 RepID=A0A060SGJ7_PYCCI|nr:hypothetical protein BN946_scf185013.g160 [Trametes cinnabarina]